MVTVRWRSKQKQSRGEFDGDEEVKKAFRQTLLDPRLTRNVDLTPFKVPAKTCCGQPLTKYSQAKAPYLRVLELRAVVPRGLALEASQGSSWPRTAEFC